MQHAAIPDSLLREHSLQLESVQQARRKQLYALMGLLGACALAVALGFIARCFPVQHDAIPITREEFAPYTADVPLNTYVQADVMYIRHAFALVGVWDLGQGSKQSEHPVNYVEATLADGSPCLLCYEGQDDTWAVLGSYVDRPILRAMTTPQYQLRLEPVTVYGRAVALPPMQELNYSMRWEQASSDDFPHRPAGMTDADYYRTLEALPVIDLDDAVGSVQTPRESSVRRAGLLRGACAIATAAAAVMLALLLIAALRLHRQQRILDGVNRSIRQAAADSPPM